MSLLDEFFKEEDQTKTPLARWLILLIIVGSILWAVWTIYIQNKLKNENVSRSLTAEEKIKVLNELKNGSTTTKIINIEEKNKVLDQLSKSQENNTTLSSEEKMKILENLR